MMKFLQFAQKLSIKESIDISRRAKLAQLLKLFQSKLSFSHKN